MKSRFFIIPAVLLLITASCGSSKSGNSADSTPDQETVRKLCEKYEIECGDFLAKTDDGVMRDIFCGECKTGYSCDETTSRCLNERTAECRGLPENAKWNTVSSITQKFDGEKWTPDTAGSYNEEPSETECRFKCRNGLPWNGTGCVPESGFPECSRENNGACEDSSTGIVWSNEAPSKMTWKSASGYCNNLTEGQYSKWRLPDIDELRTLIVNCPATATGGACGISETEECLSSDCDTDNSCSSCNSGESDVSYSKLGDLGFFWSGSALSDRADYAWRIGFGSATVSYDYKTSENKLRCVKATLSPCDPNPCEEVENSDGECTVTPNGEKYICGCNEHYTWKDSRCTADTRITECSGLPENTEWNIVSEILQTFDKTDWIPSEKTVFNQESSTRECRFKCKNGYVWNSEKCVPYTPSGLPECGADSSFPCEDTSMGMIWSEIIDTRMDWGNAKAYCYDLDEGGYSDWHLPNVDEARTAIRNCSTLITGGACRVSESNNCLSFMCNMDQDAPEYEHASDRCNCMTDNSELNIFKEHNKVFWTSSPVPEYPQYAWAWSFASHSLDPENKEDIKFLHCVRSDYFLTDSHCGKHYTWDGTECIADTKRAECTGLPENAIWNAVPNIIQTWNGSAWLPSETGSYNENSSSSECRFKCAEGYTWDGNGCVLSE